MEVSTQAPEPAGAVQVSIPIRRLTRFVVTFAILVEIFFVWADYYINYGQATTIGPLRRFFNIAREDSMASWFGCMQTALIALTLGLLYLLSRALPGTSRWQRTGWLIMTCFFAYMAFDDGTEFHERMGSTYGEIQDRSPRPAAQETSSLVARMDKIFPSYNWQLLLMPAFAALGLFTAVFLWRELATPRSRILLLASLGLLALAVGLDFIEGLERDHPWNLYEALQLRYDLDPFTVPRFKETSYDALRHFSKSLEEFIEMFAQTILWGVLLVHAGRVGNPVDIRLTNDR
jgi:hypothetical protein